MTKAVLLDAMGTLVELDDPAERLRAALESETGVDVGVELAGAAFGAEVGYYLEHQIEGGDEAGLDRLRDECARVLHTALGEPGARMESAAVRRALLAGLAFKAYPDAAPALAELRARGLRLVVASNWDCSLPQWLERAGIAPLIDGYASSAVIGEAKPHPAVFRAALAIAGVEAHEAVHVGDSLDGDIAGAKAAGIRAILVQREGEPPAGVEAVRSLAAVSSLL